MSVEQARVEYAWAARASQRGAAGHGGAWALFSCGACQRIQLYADAASIAYDLAVAQACEERARRAVAWA